MWECMVTGACAQAQGRTREKELGWEGRNIKRRKGKTGRKLKTEPQDTPASLPTMCPRPLMLRVKRVCPGAFPEVLLGRGPGRVGAGGGLFPRA